METREDYRSERNADICYIKPKVPPMHTVQRSARDVSIIYSAGDLMVNTREHFSDMKEFSMNTGNPIIL